ncbi:hypothetical protein LCGC14_1380000, partial [marine sediment metagenome]
MIKQGDRVNVVWTFPKTGDEIMEATVLSMPRGAGDLIHLKTDSGNLYAVNPHFWGFSNL